MERKIVFGFALALGCTLVTTQGFAESPNPSNDPEEVKQQIADLEKEVYKPGNARKAHQDIDVFCAKVKVRLRGLDRKTWEPIAAICGQAKARMTEYNKGDEPRNFTRSKDPPPTQTVKKSTTRTTTDSVPPRGYTGW